MFSQTLPADRPPKAKRTIMIAVDGSDQSKYAFKWSVEHVLRETDWVLLVVCVQSSSSAKWTEIPVRNSGEDSADGNGSALTAVERAEQSRLQTLLDSYTSELNSRMIASKPVVLKGDAKQALVSKSSQLNVDIMIMGSRGMGAIKKALVGSVSDYCVHNASCPVLIVRKPAN